MPEINLQYLRSTGMGYGRMGSYIADECVKQGITVYDHLAGSETAVEHGRAVADYLNEGRTSGKANVIVWITVPPHATGWWAEQASVIYTMWEGSRLPESYRERFDEFDTIIVPSPQNLELFSKYHDNVQYQPLGVDPVRWAPRGQREPGRDFRFLIAGSGKRKGTDLAVKAFKRLFGKDGSWGDGPIPWLILKNPRGEDYHGSRIQMVSGKMTDEEEADLYASAHCYLQPSRGEGFGLQPLQAIAQGCPTILTDAHGHESYAPLGLGIGYAMQPSSYFLYGEAGDWWEPDFEQLCARMKDVYDNYDRHARRAAHQSDHARRLFSWERTTNGMLDIIGRDRLGPYTGADVWHQPTHKLYKVITNKDWFTEIAGYDLAFKQGVTYYEIEDVKRILFEAGILDPACLDDDDPDNSGLAPEQVDRAGKYRAMYGDCPACGRPLEGVRRQ